jgi:hypothetical protein
MMAFLEVRKAADQESQFIEVDSNGILRLEDGTALMLRVTGVEGSAVTNATGTGAIAVSYSPNSRFWLESITMHLSAAGMTTEDFTVTLNANDGAAYDAVLLRRDLSVGSVVDLLWQPAGGPLLCEAGDAIVVAWPNTEARTYGLRIVARSA